jgi:glycosyltransferase involved in cell wall biosynthesis
MNKPVIVANVRSYDEIVAHGVDGFMLPVGDPIIWANTIVDVMSNKKKCLHMRSVGRKKPEQKFDISKSGDLMESVYQELINRKKSRQS